MTIAVLDASALLALILGEPGGERVAGILKDCAMATINVGEVVGHFARLDAPDADIRAMLDPLPFLRVVVDAELAFAAGSLLRTTSQAGLSLADRTCLALARRLGVRAVTADRPWQRIQSAVGVDIELIR